MPEPTPRYPQPYRLFNPATGHPLFSGPNGQPGYASAQFHADSWVQPDGVTAWFYDTSAPDQANRVALGLDVTWQGDGGIGYDGAYAAAVRHGASTLPDSASNVVCLQGGGRVPAGTSQADLFAAIAMAESSAHWSDHNLSGGPQGDDSIGLWQVNLKAHPQYRAINLYNIDANAQAAAEVSGGWVNACPWSTYQSGAFLQYLRHGTPPIGQTTPPPPAPPQPTPKTGPVESVVDAAVDFFIPDAPIIGGWIRSHVKAALHPIAHAADVALAAIENVARDLFGQAESLARQLVHDAFAGVQALVSAAESVLRGLIGAVDAAWRAALSFADGVLRGLIGAVDAAWRAALSFADGVLRGLIGAVDAAWRAGVSFSDGVLRGLIGAVDAAWRAGVGALEAVVHGLVSVVDAAWRAGVGALEAVVRALLHDLDTALRDLIGAVDAGWRGFVRDVFGPVERELRHLADDVLGPAEQVIAALVQLAEWVIAAARYVILAPLDVAETVSSITTDEIVQGARDAFGL